VVVSLSSTNTIVSDFKSGTEYIVDAGVNINGVTTSNIYAVTLPNGAKVTFLGSTFSNNVAARSAMGNDGTVSISGSIFYNNLGTQFAGGLLNFGTATISSTRFTSNTSNGAGGIYNYGGVVSISGSTFSANTTKAGGVLNNIGTASVGNSLFAGNFDNMADAMPPASYPKPASMPMAQSPTTWKAPRRSTSTASSEPSPAMSRGPRTTP